MGFRLRRGAGSVRLPSDHTSSVQGAQQHPSTSVDDNAAAQKRSTSTATSASVDESRFVSASDDVQAQTLLGSAARKKSTSKGSKAAQVGVGALRPKGMSRGKKALTSALMGLALLTTTPSLAQAQQIQPPTTPTSSVEQMVDTAQAQGLTTAKPWETRLTTTQDDAKASSNDKAGWRVQVAGSNDNLVPNALRAADEGLNWNQAYADDDGFTNEISAQVTRTQGDNQYQGDVRMLMVTEDHAYRSDKLNGGYEGRRVDVLEHTHVWNHSFALQDLDATAITTLGGGMQHIGQLGQQSLQEWFHKEGGFGGRLNAADGLQSNYTVDGLRHVPLVVGGVKLVKPDVIDGILDLHAGMRVDVPLGQGLGQAVAGAGFVVKPFDRLTIDGQVTYSGTWASGEHLDFMAHDKHGLGASFGAELEVFKGVSFFGRFDVEGRRGESVGTIGLAFTFGGGNSGWNSLGW